VDTAARVGVFVSAYEAGVNARRRGAARFSADVADFGTRRERNPIDMIGRAHAGTYSQHKTSGAFGRALAALLRLVLPVVLLLTAGAACIVYSDIPVEGLGTFAGKPLSLGLALLPLTFFVIHLTNRRYGASYAFAQIVAAWAVAIAMLPSMLPLLPSGLDARVVAGVCAGLFVAQILAVVLFDGLRGPTWWRAPFFASLIGGIALCLIGFPAAFSGTGAHWSGEMLGYMGLTSGEAVLLLVPYALLRSLVPPRPGYGGY
jgi:uncharacterized PurR-regulated membrane protein YhhQ (DUF165 family)